MRHVLRASLLLTLLSAGVIAQPLSSKSKLCKSMTITSGLYYQHKNATLLHSQLMGLAGCEYIHGDLILTNFGADPVSETPLDGDIRKLKTDFLDSIVEITGRLVIHRVNLEVVSFKNLRVIRGYNSDNINPFYAVEIWQSIYPMELRMPKLSAILQGNVSIIGVLSAETYCYISRRINWSSLFQSAEQKFSDDVSSMIKDNKQISVRDYQAIETACSSLARCDASCHTEKSGRQLCWSSGPEGCQSYHRCSTRSCEHGICFKNLQTREEECCNSRCLGGCITGESNGCFSCLNVSLDGSCHYKCPGRYNYNPGTGNEEEDKTKSMWQVGNICVNKCPLPFIESSSGHYCLSRCKNTETPINGSCTSCSAENEVCVNCDVDQFIINDKQAETLINRNCTIWKATKSSFDVDVKEIKNVKNLLALEKLRVFYGRLFIRRADQLVDNLRILRNLQVVTDNFAILLMKTKYLSLVNLRYAKNLLLKDINGLCRAWFPSKRIDELKKVFPITLLRTALDNTSAECLNATCDPLCRGECWGPGPDMCVDCKNFKVNDRCYATCKDANNYQNLTQCHPCHPQCIGGCNGPAATDCNKCRNLNEYGTCVASCSREMRAGSKGNCYSIASARLLGVGISVGLLVLALLILLPLAYFYYNKRMRQYEMVDLDEYLTDPKNPSDMAKLLIVNDDDVVKQKEIGSGAFGTVFRGVLRSSSTKGVCELPVAIKVLRGHSPKLGQELLNEAAVLARVRHPSCIRLVALCLTQEPQLITALMPRGCLLEFVRAHRNRIGAERMLRWSLQVAQGMEYLESLGIVHRDLAARNVLLQTADQVRITDFGLARLLDISEGEYVQTAGLLPVKWLGVECFESGLFSHKSDVWSYGVLLWEICTFGESPYNPYGIRSVEDITGLLKKGIRLNQPDICSIDFYNILLSCWLPHPESRPSFTDLVATMKECLNMPSKYIAIRRSGIETFETDGPFGFDSEPTKRLSNSSQLPAKHIELNSYISDPTIRQPKSRHQPRFVAPSREACEANVNLLRSLSGEDPDGYMLPRSPPPVAQNFDFPVVNRRDGDEGVGLEDYLAPNKSNA